MSRVSLQSVACVSFHWSSFAEKNEKLALVCKKFSHRPDENKAKGCLDNMSELHVMAQKWSSANIVLFSR